MIFSAPRESAAEFGVLGRGSGFAGLFAGRCCCGRIVGGCRRGCASRGGRAVRLVGRGRAGGEGRAVR